MATYVFERMDQGDAADFGAADSLIFLDATASTLLVEFNGATNLTQANYVLSVGDQELTFNATSLANAAAAGEVTFTNGDQIFFGSATVTSDDGTGIAVYGTDGANTVDLTESAGSDTVFAGGGADTIDATTATPGDHDTSTETDYLMGGAGGDTITGGIGNDHIFGFSNAAAGEADGADSLVGGEGNDYIHGNAGNDTIDGGADNDRIYGGAGNDTLNGDEGLDYLQGNKGNDVIDGGDDNDTLRGGAGNDTLTGGADDGDDSLLGDAGNDSLEGGDGNDVIDGGADDDTIVGGAGFDILSGGDGEDMFMFEAGDANLEADADQDAFDSITDFTNGDDTIDLGFDVEVFNASASSTFGTVEDALDYANGILTDVDPDTGNLVSVQVGDDAYLFFNSAGTDGAEADSVILLADYAAADVEDGDFA
jgi:serralysin